MLNATAQKQPVQAGTQLFYGAGAAANAAMLAPQFGTKAVALKSLPADHIEVLIGSPAVGGARGHRADEHRDGRHAVRERDAERSHGHADGRACEGHGGHRRDDDQLGDSSVVAPNARYGIPCVY